jgi:hypothetical protein
VVTPCLGAAGVFGPRPLFRQRAKSRDLPIRRKLRLLVQHRGQRQQRHHKCANREFAAGIRTDQTEDMNVKSRRSPTWFSSHEGIYRSTTFSATVPLFHNFG